MEIMFENIMKFFKKLNKKENKTTSHSKDAAKERLHLVLMQDRANVSADFLELMKQEIIEVIKKYIDGDESAIDGRLTNKENPDGTNGAPALYANIPIMNIKNETKKIIEVKEEKESKKDKSKKQLDKAQDNKVESKEKFNKNKKIQELDRKKQEENKEDNSLKQEINDITQDKEEKKSEKDDYKKRKTNEEIKSEN